MKAGRKDGKFHLLLEREYVLVILNALSLRAEEVSEELRGRELDLGWDWRSLILEERMLYDLRNLLEKHATNEAVELAMPDVLAGFEQLLSESGGDNGHRA